MSGSDSQTAVQAAITRTASEDHRDMVKKAKTTRAGFKRPAFWVLVFGWSLALCAGQVNVIAYRSFGTFVSHVTGSSTALGLRFEGYHQGRNDFETVGDASSAVLSFLLGAFLCGLLIDKNHVHFGGKAFYGVALVGNSLLLVLSIIVESHTAAVCLSAAACGLQNAMCTAHFGAVVRTTHVTGTVTDIGSTLGRMAMIYLRKGCRRSRLNILERAEVSVDARKLLVLLPMWLCFLLGSLSGAYLFSWFKTNAMLVPAAVTFCFGTVYMVFRQSFKQFFKKLKNDHLDGDLEGVERSLARMSRYLSTMRKCGEQDPASEADPENQKAQLDDLESEIEHIVDTIHQVEADIEDLRSRGSEPVEETRSHKSHEVRGKEQV